ncbi:MAG: amidohydrolase [Chloroflexi bacterium]|nr:amidohydrolase [Chloroflexota bacterium]
MERPVKSIDIHAHLTPQCFIQAMNRGEEWHGVKPGTMRVAPRAVWTPEQRLNDMNSLGVDVHVVSTGAAFYFYDQDPQVIAAMHRECNEEVHQMTMDYPDRFKGFAQIPMQDVNAAIKELDHVMNNLGFVGAMINDTADGRTFDEPEYLPLWQAAEQMGAVMFIHQQGGDTLVTPRLNRYHLANTIGNLVDRAVTFASFVFGGVMDKCPDLKVCLAHGGGYTCFGAGRMDRGWQVRSEAREHISQPPSAYLSKFYYDCLTHSEPALRMLIDTVGIDRVIFGTDWPADMAIDWPVSWVLSLESLTQEEKEAILWKNMERLLGV